MEPQEFFLGIVILISLFGLFYFLYNKHNGNNNIKEGFEEESPLSLEETPKLEDLSELSINTNILDTKVEDNNQSYTILGPSLIEESAKEVFGEYDPIACNLKITNKEQFCYNPESQKRWKRQLVPIHIIQDHQGQYLAVFNDGQLYRKENLIDKKLWIGPLNNSLAHNQDGQEVPLRMVMLYPFEKETNVGQSSQEVQYKVLKLLGVGVDGNLYVKDTEDYQSNWNQISGGNNQNLIYIFTDFVQSKEKTSLVPNSELLAEVEINDGGSNDYYPKLWAINGNGQFMQKETNSLESKFKVFNHIVEPVPMIKVCWDKNGFMLGIGSDFRIYKKKSTQWKTLQAWDLDNGPSEYKVIDLLLDKDGHFFGVVLDDRLGRIRLMKQTEFYYLAEFEFLELTNQHKPQIFSTYDIIHHKSGFDIQTYNSYQDSEEEIYRTDNLEAIHQRNMLESRRKLQALCKKRNPQRNLVARNFEFENLLSEQKNKIKELSQEIVRLAHPDFSQISKVSPQGELLTTQNNV